MAAVCSLLLFPAATAQQTQQKKKPNIIVFLVDDMGWQDTSVPFWGKSTAFNKRYRTPNMERLAREGLKFTSGYAFPVCTPSRVSLITGVNPARHRITHWTSPNANTNTDYPDTTLNFVPWNIQGMSPVAGIANTFHATPLPSLLKKAGYYTILSGKAHFASSGTPGADPKNVGFDVNIAGSSIGHPASYYGESNYDKPVNGKPNRNAVPGLEAYHGTSTFLSDALTIEALKALRKPVSEGEPFFLYLSHYAVHTPILPDPRFVDRYLKMGLDSIEASYASLVEGMDKSLGDVMDFLEKEQLAEHTVIFFLSDNGGLSTAPLRGGEGYTHNLPLRAGKGSVYEGGIRVPLLVKWPGVTRAGKTAGQYVIVEDLFPTILEIAGIKKADTHQQVDGKSMLPLLHKPELKDTERELIWHHPHRWIPQEGPNIHWASAFRKGDWKLVYDYRARKLELYNLKDDIGELRDLAALEPEKTKELARLFTKRLRQYGAQRPTWKPGGQPVPWPDEIAVRQAGVEARK
ncbi:MAG: sulfatase [Cytophagaceae bacterium SCN 52-12]|nr:MAG: sulfatase [Cytophagaceae bacterium SCN 52-12]